MSSFTDTNKPVSEMRQNFDLLEKFSFFSVLPLKAIKLLAFAAERQHFHQDEIIFEEGEDYGVAFIILSGQLTLMKKHGASEHLVKQFQTGDIIGMTALLSAQPSLYQLKAGLDTKVLTIARKHFIKIQEQFPETIAVSHKTLLQEIYQWERKNLKKSDLDGINLSGATAL